MNVFDFNLGYSLSDFLISIIFFVLSFFTFLYFGYFRDFNKRDKDEHDFKDLLIEGYYRKFEQYDKIISELRTKMDVVELKNNPDKNIVGSAETAKMRSDVNIKPYGNTSRDVESVMDDVIITRGKQDDIKDGEGLGLNTVNSILTILDVPLTSREIQKKINKSREHTSRLLKKLFSENIVMRDESTRPYKYEITDEGRKLLEQTTSWND